MNLEVMDDVLILRR